jgi:hypothetical protein
MKYPLTPDLFNVIAITLAKFKWNLIAWSIFFLILFVLLQSQIQTSTPTMLIWFAIFILFAALQSLVIAAFIFFFQVLPSTREHNANWQKFYRVVEWCETALFTLLLPLPLLLFIYAFIKLSAS